MSSNLIAPADKKFDLPPLRRERNQLFSALKEAQILTERRWVHYNTVRAHSSLGGQPPVPEILRLAN